MPKPIETARALMRMALALLEAADPLDEGLAALRLRAAIAAVEEVIDATRGEPPSGEG